MDQPDGGNSLWPFIIRTVLISISATLLASAALWYRERQRRDSDR